MTAQIGTRVKQIQVKDVFHLPGVSLASIDADKHQAEMTLHAQGVFVTMKGGSILVPFSNLKGIVFYPETAPQPAAAEKVKRA